MMPPVNGRPPAGRPRPMPRFRACRAGLGLAALLTLAGLPAAEPAAPPGRARRVYNTTRLSGPAPVIDGRLDDPCWREAGAWAGGFTQFTPRHAAPASQATEIKILYDDRHLYIAMRAHDRPVAQRSRKASPRDMFAGDSVGIDFDSYRDQRTSFEFSLSASGQKVDQRLSNVADDLTWNAVWEGKVTHAADSWTAEFLIPLSQLRFDPRNTVWGLHAWRWIDRLREESHWHLLANDDSGFVKSFGELRGLEGLRPARRFELVPYGSVSVDTGRGPATRFRAGLDAKLGLTSNTTLDASLLPDFGQVEMDPTVMNLTAFETLQIERRPLFLEGKDIFDFPFNDDALFYSRRIGQPPGYQPAGASGPAPRETTLLGALKLSGKTGRGFSFGLLGALTDREEVMVDDPAGPRQVTVAARTTHAVLRGQQDFRQGDTVVGGIVTYVRRDIPSDELAAQQARESLAGGVDLTHYWARREYFARAVAVGSEVRGDPRAISRLQLGSARYYQRPADGLIRYDPTREALSGGGLWLQAGKASRGRWRWTEEVLLKSAGLDFNELGYLAKAGRREQSTTVAYVVREPAAWYRNYRLELVQDNSWTTRDEFLGSGLALDGAAEFKNKWTVTASLNARSAGLDPEALRGGPILRVPARWGWAGAVGTDGTKRISGRLYARGTQAQDAVSTSAGYGGKLSVRPVSALQLSLAFDATEDTDRQRHLELEPAGAGRRPFVSRLAGSSRSVSLRADWIIRPELSLQYYGNPFGSTVRFSDFRRVLAPEAEAYGRRVGAVLPATRAGGVLALDENSDGTADHRLADPDGNAASFHSNLVLKWEYRRGSMLYVVWAQEREGAAAPEPSHDAWSSLAGLRRRAPDNRFIVKLTYWFSS